VRDLIVDGYNVIHASPEYRRLLDLDVATACGRLVDGLASYAAGRWHVTVVFDGGGQSGEETRTETGGVVVINTAAGTTADTVVERLAREAREASRGVIVVTSDATTQWTVLGGGTVRMSARELIAEMAGERGESDQHRRGGPRSSTLDARVSKAARSSLLRMLEGRERGDPE
jgi:predicted RNA-binding protein with PIN domain